MRRIWLVLSVFACALSAQQAEVKGWEAYGHFGGGKAYDDEGNIGSGVAFGAGVGKRVTRRLGIEGEWSRFSHERQFVPGFGTKGHGDFVMANGLLHFAPEGRVQPYVLAGAGLLKYQRHDAGFAWNAGFGVKGFLTEHWFLRPELRFQCGNGTRRGGPEPPLWQVRFQMGVGYRW
jgi:opacity protein-like surface antigen